MDELRALPECYNRTCLRCPNGEEAELTHILLAHARTYDRGDIELAPPSCDYDIRIGAWIVKESGDLLVASPEHPHPPQTKKADVETGEDQKGY